MSWVLILVVATTTGIGDYTERGIPSEAACQQRLEQVAAIHRARNFAIKGGLCAPEWIIEKAARGSR